MAWTRDQSEALARDALEGMGDRWNHVCSVALAAERLSGAVSADVVSAAWLHDVGYAPGTEDSGHHSIDGAEFLQRRGVPDPIVSLVAYHTGAEFEAEERGLVQRLEKFVRPPQDDLDLLTLADLTSGPAGQRVEVSDRIDEILRRYRPEHPVHRAVTRSRSYLEECCARAAARVGYPI